MHGLHSKNVFQCQTGKCDDINTVIEFIPKVAFPGLTTKFGTWPVSGWLLVLVQP